MAQRKERSLSESPKRLVEPSHAAREPDVDRAWGLVLGAASLARDLDTDIEAGYALGDGGRLVRAAGRAATLLWRNGAWVPAGGWSETAEALLDLYLPVCVASKRRIVVTGHLGQSLDGQIATASGDSDFVTGTHNIVHLHRMRALANAVIVGAGTVESDDPRLTTRLVSGPSPVRVVIDPSRRLPPARQVFNDGAAPTLVACGDNAAASEDPTELIRLPSERGRLDLGALLEALRERGLYSVFVEGGGVTVSAFLEAGLLDRLQIAIAPLVTGQGRPGLRLPARLSLREGLRPAHRVFAMGADVLFDCDLKAPQAAALTESLRRVF